jgi:hypothetical protein
MEVWKSIFDWATVILIALTVLSGAGALVTGDIIAQRQEARLRQFDKDLTDARTELGKQQEKAATVETTLAEQKERTALAEKAASDAALDLARLKQPRILKNEQRERIVSKVSRFPGTEFDVAASNSSEPLNLVMQIEESLVAAHWKEIDWPEMSPNGRANTLITRPGKASLGLAIEHGVTIQVEMSDREQLLEMAKILAVALSAEGISAEAQFMSVNQGNQRMIHIVVGEKPIR